MASLTLTLVTVPSQTNSNNIDSAHPGTPRLAPGGLEWINTSTASLIYTDRPRGAFRPIEASGKQANEAEGRIVWSKVANTDSHKHDVQANY
ncbi:hypothetical protein BaRGS_00007375 [Batillaria attramentaria]|uniref:Uncharacterized protein n=1 Tax=Batillaria attramentaria TaxID=370345 RepID=A0ABD0LP73_9CAEN